MRIILRGLVPVTLTLAVLVGVPRVASADDKDKSAPPVADVQDFVFLGETRPILVRLHVRIDGKPLQAAFDDLMKYLFGYLDVNGDGSLSKEEAERAPTASSLTGGLGQGLGRGRRGPAQAGPSLSDLDTDKDGKVSLAELTAYYRKNGLQPFQFQLTAAPANPLGGAAAFLGGPRPAPPVAAVSEAVFALLDSNKDGKLTKEKLAAAPALLLKLDEDEDELVTSVELLPNANASADPYAEIVSMVRPGRTNATVSSKTLVPVTTSGEAPADLVRRLLERYSKKADKLSRKDLGLDEATFARLDTNKDGFLDRNELAGIVKQAPDLELVVRLGKKQNDEARIELVSPSPLGSQIKVADGLVKLDLGLTQVDLRGSDDSPRDVIGGFVRQQLGGQFKQADADGNGYIDAKEAQSSRVFRPLFKAMDRDGDGKVTEKEMKAYFEHVSALQTRARAGSASLVLKDQSSGLFQLLDTNRDGRLSIREMRNAVKLLGQLDPTGRGYFTRADVPHNYELVLRRGPAEGGANAANNLVARYLGGGNRAQKEPTMSGPAWFRKMDRNRDGDVSRKEFLGSDEQFRKLDLDGDGLISLDEAEKAEAQLRTKAEQNR